MERNIISIARMLYDPKKTIYVYILCDIHIIMWYMSVGLSKFTLMGRFSCQVRLFTFMFLSLSTLSRLLKIPTTLCLADCQDHIIGNRQDFFGLMQLNGVNMHNNFLHHSSSVLQQMYGVNVWNINVLSSKQLQIWLGKKIAVGLFQRSKCFSQQKKKIVFIADAVNLYF